MRLLVVGASSSPTCGLRDHAAMMEPALRARGASVDTLWWERDPAWAWRQTHRSAINFLSRLRARLAEANHDAVLWHYAVFDYGPRTAWGLSGLPVYAPAFARALVRARSPLVVLVHESAYPWSRLGWQRNALAAGHRAALVAVVDAADGIILTSVPRERWLTTRRWLPTRPWARVPVCATLTAPAGPSGNGGRRIGVLGFATDDARPDVVVGAVRSLRARGLNAELVLLGAPGPDGERARQWAAVARALGCGSSLSFTGVVSADELARELAAVDVIAFPQGSGAGANKGTLGMALAFAKPVVALGGRDTWEQAVRAGAVVTSPPTPAALAARLEPLLADQQRRHQQGAAGHAFYDREMSPAVCARRQLEFIGAVARV